YYSRYDAPADTTKALTAKNEFQKVYYHAIGEDQSADKLVYEDTKYAQRTFGMTVTEDERFGVLTSSQGGSKGNAAYFREMESQDPTFRPVIETYDDDFTPIGNVEGKLYFRTNRNAPNGRVIIVDPAAPTEGSWKDILPEKPEPLMSASLVGGKIV